VNAKTQEQPGSGLVIEALTPIRFEVTKAALASMKRRLLPLAKKPIESRDDYQAVVKAIAECRTTRTAIEARRQELKAPALEYGRQVDGLAGEITEAIRAIEDPLKEAKAKEDDRKAEEKRQAELAEQARLAKLQKMVNEIDETARHARDAESLAALEPFEGIVAVIRENLTDEIYQDLLPQAQLAYDRLVDAVGTRKAWLQDEAERKARLEEQEAELERQRQEMAEQQRKLDQQRKEQEAEEARLQKEREEREAQERAEREEREHQEAMQRQADEEKRQQELARRRAARIKPDQEKLADMADRILALADLVVAKAPKGDQVQLKTTEGRETWKEAKASLRDAAAICRGLE
jgi:colicin import membrane protein